MHGTIGHSRERRALRNSTAAARILPVLPGDMIYHNGQVMRDTVQLYYIWYGSWATSTQNILRDFGNTIGGTTWLDIVTTYYDTVGSCTSNVILGGEAIDAYSLGKTLSDTTVFSVVKAAMQAGKVPISANALYFVLTSSDVTESSGFCSQYCGWHTSDSYTAGGTTYDIKYGFVGNPAACPSSCAYSTLTPNNDVGADGMASIIAHEVVEAMSDPDISAWSDASGNENAGETTQVASLMHLLGRMVTLNLAFLVTHIDRISCNERCNIPLQTSAPGRLERRI